MHTKEYKLWQLVLYPSAQIFTGFALTRHIGWAWDTAFILFSLCFLAVNMSAYMVLRTKKKVLLVKAWDAPKIQEPVKVQIKSMNQFESVTQSVKRDTERMFCRALLEFPNLTESYWLNGKPSKWQSMGGVGRKDFVECKDRLTRIGALERTNSRTRNSPHRIADRRILEHRASRPTPPL